MSANPVYGGYDANYNEKWWYYNGQRLGPGQHFLGFTRKLNSNEYSRTFNNLSNPNGGFDAEVQWTGHQYLHLLARSGSGSTRVDPDPNRSVLRRRPISKWVTRSTPRGSGRARCADPRGGGGPRDGDARPTRGSPVRQFYVRARYATGSMCRDSYRSSSSWIRPWRESDHHSTCMGHGRASGGPGEHRCGVCPAFALILRSTLPRPNPWQCSEESCRTPR